MGKGGLFVAVYSLILITLFVTFSYLMMTVNPPLLEDRGPGNVTLPDDVLYADEVLVPSEDFQYGLDKSAVGLNSIDINFTSYHSVLVDDNKYDFKENVNPNIRRVVPPVWPDPSTTLTTRKDNLPTLPKTKIPAKGFRRSISDDSKESSRQNVPRSLFLKIINDDGQPRIEIKLASDENSKKKTRQYRSSGNRLKPGLETLFHNNTHHEDRSHDFKQSVIKIEENKTLVFNIYDSSINLANESGISIVHLDEEQLVSFEDALNVVNNSTFSTPSPHVFKLNFLHSNATKMTDTKSSKMISKEENKITTSNNEDHGTRNKNINAENIVRLQSLGTKVNDTKVNVAENNEDDSESNFKSTDSLIGLMIPEATATLPFNYHFIDNNDKNVFSSVIKGKKRSKRD